jgi:hypothetical protein
MTAARHAEEIAIWVFQNEISTGMIRPRITARSQRHQSIDFFVPSGRVRVEVNPTAVRRTGIAGQDRIKMGGWQERIEQAGQRVWLGNPLLSPR